MTPSLRIMVFMIVAAAVFLSPIESLNPRKLDDTTPATTTNQPNDEMKCGNCPCGTTCYSSPPPPVPSPPPPVPSPPPPPPPPPKKPSPSPGVKCPPPPYSGGGGGGGGSGQAPPNNIYVSGPPGDIYPVVQSVSAASRSFMEAVPQLMMAVGLMGMIAFW